MMSTEAKTFADEALAVDWHQGIERFEELAKKRDAKSARLLIELLGHRRVWVREQAIEAMNKFARKQDARRAARIAIESKNFFVRNEAVEMLEFVGTNTDVPALIRVLQQDKYWVARASAASSLGELRTKASIAALSLALSKDRWWCVRAYAANALCRTGDKRFVPLIEQRIKRDPEPAVLPSLYDAMVMMGKNAYRERVIDLLYEDDYWYMVYLRACVVLESLYVDGGKPLPERAIKGLRRVMKYDVAKAAKWSSRDLLKKVGITVRAPAVPKNWTL